MTTNANGFLNRRSPVRAGPGAPQKTAEIVKTTLPRFNEKDELSELLAPWCSACTCAVYSVAIDVLTGPVDRERHPDPPHRTFYRYCARCVKFITRRAPLNKERRSSFDVAKYGRPLVAKWYAPTTLTEAEQRAHGFEQIEQCAHGCALTVGQERVALWVGTGRLAIVCAPCADVMRTMLQCKGAA